MENQTLHVLTDMQELIMRMQRHKNDTMDSEDLEERMKGGVG